MDQSSKKTGSQSATATSVTAAAPGAYQGSCHCGAVRFEVQLEPGWAASRCNCSICTKNAMTAAIVKPDGFRLAAGEENLLSYQWGGKISRRFFCKTCGVQCFARGHLVELGGDYVSFNVNALDDVDPATVKVVYWDGRHNNWQAGPRPTPWPVFTEAAPA